MIRDHLDANGNELFIGDEVMFTDRDFSIVQMTDDETKVFKKHGNKPYIIDEFYRNGQCITKLSGHPCMFATARFIKTRDSIHFLPDSLKELINE
jgi:hypothetical protein